MILLLLLLVLCSRYNAEMKIISLEFNEEDYVRRGNTEPFNMGSRAKAGRITEI